MSVMILPLIEEKRFVFEELARVVERATRAEDHRFFNIMKLHAKLAAVAERCRTDSGR